MLWIIDWLEAHFQSVKQPVENAKLWYISPRDHIWDSVFWIPFFILCYYVGYKLEKRVAPEKLKVIPFKRTYVDWTVAGTLLVLLCLSTMVKYTRNPYDTLIMLAPCHFVTLVLIGALIHPNQQLAAWLFNMAMYLTVYTILALAAPDIKNLDTFGRAVFFVQHGMLLIVPYCYLLTDRFPLYGCHTWAMYFQATGVIGLWGFVVQHTAAMYSGVNVNYFLHPPESPKWFQGRFYLSMLCLLIMSVGYVCGHVLPPYVHRYAVRNKSYRYDDDDKKHIE